MTTLSNPITTTCQWHGEQVAAVVCRHQLEIRDRPVGFVENSTDPNDQQAWCDECERCFLSERDMSEEFRKFNHFAIVCISCYADLRALHAVACAT